MLPQSLDDILDEINYVEYDIDIMKLDISTDPFKLEFLIKDTEGYTDETKLLITAFGAVDFFVDKEGRSSFIHLENDNPLLWQFNDIQCDLYVSGQPKQFEKLIVELLECHDSLFGQYYPFDLHSIGILKNGHGLFKKGSKKILTQLADILNENGIKTSVISEQSPQKEAQDLKILFIGYSYIIANKFDFEILK